MKAFIREFCKRGALFAALGPVILAIVYIFLSANGVVESITVQRMITEILSSTLMAFIAAGVSAVYTVDRLWHGTAGLIQGAVLFLDYIGIYLLNGWLPMKPQAIALFAAIFIGVFAVIWIIVYFIVRANINRFNKEMSTQ